MDNKIILPGDSLFEQYNSKGMFGRRNSVLIDVVDVKTKEVEQRVHTNLILYRGRNWLMQRAANLSMTGRTDWHEMYLSWLGVGTGGATSGNPLVPLDPALGDCDLTTPGTIGGGLRYVSVSGKHYHQIDDSYPIFVSDDDVDNADVCSLGGTYVDPLTGLTYNKDKFLILMYKFTLASEEANGTEYQDLNEVVLYASPSNSTSYAFTSSDQFVPFAKATFSTIRKTDARELLISWLIYF